MKNTKKSNGITRFEFLKNSGFLAAGITLLPGFVNANPGDEKNNGKAVAAKISEL